MKLKHYTTVFILGILQMPVLVFAQGLIIPSSSFVTASTGNLILNRNWTNNGKFTHNGGTVLFNKTGAQSMSGSTATTFNNVTIGSGSVTTISAAGQKIKRILKCNDTLNAGGNLTLLSTNVQTALIDGTGTGQVLGNVIMQRYLDSSFGYRVISSPFQAAVLGQLSGVINLSAAFPRFYWYNENVAYTGWASDTVSTDTLQPMYGYSANFGTTTSNATFSLNGSVNNGAISYTLYNHNNTYTLGFNLVGNPYPSPIDWTASSGWTKTNIDNAIYYYHHCDTNQYYGSYSSYIAGVSSDGIANNIIPSMQGFFIHVSNGSFPVTGSLSCTNAVRTTNLTPYYHKTSNAGSKPLVRITAAFTESTRVADPAVIYFDEKATVDFDNDLDALKLMNTDASIPSLYSVAGDNNNMSIQALPPFADSIDQLIPLGLLTDKNGMVDFTMRNAFNTPVGMHIYFFDRASGSVQDLRTTATYSRYLDKGKYNNRFFLMFTTKDKSGIPVLNNELNAYTRGDDLFVYIVGGTNHLSITNMLGQVVLKQELTGNGYHQINCPFATGIYVATLFSDMGKQSKKIFLGK